MRLFLAINLEPDVRRAIADTTEPLRAIAPSLRWTQESRLHLTLKFLGEQADSVVARLPEALDGAALRHKSFAIRVGEIGAFPNFRRARVVWVGVDRDPRLELLHHHVEVACEQIGLELDGRPFRPHVTLARVDDARSVEGELRKLWKTGKQVDLNAESDVHSVDLMQSTPATGGSRYERLHAATLRAR